MNIKLDHLNGNHMFNHKEISHLPKSEQKELLAQAKYVAFNELGLAPKAALYFVSSLLFGFAIGVLLSQVTGSYSVASLGILVGIFTNQLSNGFLISKGLEHVLSKKS